MEDIVQPIIQSEKKITNMLLRLHATWEKNVYVTYYFINNGTY